MSKDNELKELLFRVSLEVFAGSITLPKRGVPKCLDELKDVASEASFESFWQAHKEELQAAEGLQQILEEIVCSAA